MVHCGLAAGGMCCTSLLLGVLYAMQLRSSISNMSALGPKEWLAGGSFPFVEEFKPSWGPRSNFEVEAGQTASSFVIPIPDVGISLFYKAEETDDELCSNLLKNVKVQACRSADDCEDVDPSSQEDDQCQTGEGIFKGFTLVSDYYTLMSEGKYVVQSGDETGLYVFPTVGATPLRNDLLKDPAITLYALLGSFTMMLILNTLSTVLCCAGFCVCLCSSPPGASAAQEPMQVEML